MNRSQSAAVQPEKTDDHTKSAVDSVSVAKSTLMAGFQGDIQPVKAPFAYRFGLLLVTIVMVILPLIYLGITLLVCYVVYYHTVNHAWLLQEMSLMALLVYLAPIFIGGVLVIFMFKPLLAHPANPPQREPLHRHDEPLLFAFVEQICTVIGSPPPQRIEVDCQVNASARFRRGLLSMFGNDLVLTIGMPLAAGLTLRQFAGVLAHEFGHFSQGAAMRLVYIVRAINAWFTRVVYERDTWDEVLVELSNSLNIRLSWIVYLARLGVWLTRRILWVLMLIGHGVSGYMLRQMEYDADRTQTRLVGCEVFESTMHRIVALSVAERAAQSDLNDFYREGRLSDNQPQLIVHNLNQFPPDMHEQVDQFIAASFSGSFDTHPGHSDRIASAKKENSEGVFQVEMAARDLFEHFEFLCKEVTWEFYQSIFGVKIERTNLHDMHDLLERQQEEEATFHALNRYFQNTFRANRPLRLPSWELTAPDAPDEKIAQLKEERALVRQGAPDYRNLSLLYSKVLNLNREELEAKLSAFEEVAGRRFYGALQLLFAPADSDLLVDTRIKEIGTIQDLQEECERLMQSLKHLDGQLGALSELQTGNMVLAGLSQRLSQNNRDEAAAESARRQMRESREMIMRTLKSLDASAYPFDHAGGKITVGAFALSRVPSNDDFGGIYEAAGRMIQSVSHLRARVTGRLCVIAEDVESALGLDPFPLVPETDPTITDTVAPSSDS